VADDASVAGRQNLRDADPCAGLDVREPRPVSVFCCGWCAAWAPVEELSVSDAEVWLLCALCGRATTIDAAAA
jgi:hypothetical protein